MNMIQRRFRLAEQPGTEAEVNGERLVCDPTGALYVPAHRLLVVSDLHLEKGAAFARRGMMLPPYDTLATLRILEAIITRHDPKIVISLGDNFHDRQGSSLMPPQFREMIENMARGREWIWINGNHDPDGALTLPGVSMDVLRLANLVFRHEPAGGRRARERTYAQVLRQAPSDHALAVGFVDHVRQRPASGAEQDLLRDALEAARAGEVRA